MYKVTLPREFPYEQRIRAGVVVNKVHGYEGELTDEQLEAVNADQLLTVSEAAAPKAAEPIKQAKTTSKAK
jgi:hypothetical protein